MHMTDKQLFASFFEKHLSGKRHCLKAHREPSVGARRRLVDFDIHSVSFAGKPFVKRGEYLATGATVIRQKLLAL